MKYNLAGLVCRFVTGNLVVFVRVFTSRYSAISIDSCNRWTEKLLINEDGSASLQEIADYLGLDVEEVIPCTNLKLALD